MKTRRLWRSGALLMIALHACSPTSAMAGMDEAQRRPPELQGRIEAALAAKGSAYRPRTEHLLRDGRPRFTNRLILEDSPYLRQHAHNPVDWYPWGAEAFERARREGKLVFLSVGYSTCHWCHVMERESFEDIGIARVLNAHFISIKVDREVRPDVDQVYMTAVQLIRGAGGWPMSSVLTPEGHTIEAGTYFPPAEFAHWLERAQDLWEARPGELRDRGRRIARAVDRALASGGQAQEIDDGVVVQAVAELLAEHDDLQGGFGPAPKFPQAPRLALLLDHALRAGDREALAAVVFTLQAMARGGIQDQVGGGFHRYATDNAWLVPHFEKMLYSQAQLAPLYLRAARLTGDAELARVARRTLGFVLRDLRSPTGGFYSATDADSAGEEGRFFVWAPAELEAALGPERADLAIALYGVTEAGHFGGRNVLHLPLAPATFAARHGLSREQLWRRMESIEQVLYQAREARPRPHRDEKVLTAWNGMMIAALAEAGDALAEPVYLEAARRAGEFLWSKARSGPGELKRVYLKGRATQPGFLEDYAFLGRGFVALYDATADRRWLARAGELADALWERFADATGRLSMAEAGTGAPLMARAGDMRDGAMPSGTSAALHLFAALTQRTAEPDYERRAHAILAAAAGQVRRQPAAFPSLLAALKRVRHGDTGPRQYAGKGAVRLEAQTLRAGDAQARIAIDLSMAPGWHINAAEPLQDYLIPTQIRLSQGSGGWRIDTLAYPPARLRKLGFQREPLAVFENEARVLATLTREPQEGGDDLKAWLPVELRLQACSSEHCLPPETPMLQVPLAAW